MSIKTYCDVCGKEGAEPAGESFIGSKGRIAFRVMISVDHVANSGHICTPCLLDAINHPEQSERTWRN